MESKLAGTDLGTLAGTAALAAAVERKRSGIGPCTEAGIDLAEAEPGLGRTAVGRCTEAHKLADIGAGTVAAQVQELAAELAGKRSGTAVGTGWRTAEAVAGAVVERKNPGKCSGTEACTVVAAVEVPAAGLGWRSGCTEQRIENRSSAAVVQAGLGTVAGIAAGTDPAEEPVLAAVEPGRSGCSQIGSSAGSFGTGWERTVADSFAGKLERTEWLEPGTTELGWAAVGHNRTAEMAGRRSGKSTEIEPVVAGIGIELVVVEERNHTVSCLSIR